MKSFLTQFVTVLVGGFFLCGANVSWAVVAPLSPEELKEGADHIVSGKVVDVTSKVHRSKVAAFARDRVYTIIVEVKEVAKGSGIKPGETIQVTAWKPHKRPRSFVGLQGHKPIPNLGDIATFYLSKPKGKMRQPLHPNGVRIDKASEPKDSASR